MSEVVSAFIQSWALRSPGPIEWPDLVAEAVTSALARGRAQRALSSVSDGRFGEELAARVAIPASDIPAAIAKLHAPGLYFVIACAENDEVAVREFEERYVPDVRLSLERLRFAASTVDETLQEMRITMLMGSERAPPRLLEYGARGELRGWLRVVASRIAYRLVKGAPKEVPVDVSLAAAEFVDPDIEILRQTYGEAFQEAFREAMLGLSTRDRLLLKQRFAMQTTIVELGTIYGVNWSTVSRWVADARYRLATAIRQGILQRTRGMGPSDVSSIMRLVHFEMNTSLMTYREREDIAVSR